VQVRYICEDLGVLRRRIRELERDIERKLSEHEVGTLLTTIDGIGPLTAARIIARLDLDAFDSAGAVASFVGVVPALNQSGKKQGNRAGITAIGDAALRSALWMPTLTAVRRNAWLKAHYERLLARGKLPKVALIACMRKLLTAIYSVAKHRRPFVPILPPPQPTP
jgi:transposase